MWRTVFGLEWRILRRDRSVLTVLLVFGAFLVLAALSGGKQADDSRSGVERALTLESTRYQKHVEALRSTAGTDKPLKSKDARDPMWMGRDGAARVVVLPPAPLAPMAVGLRDLQPQMVRVTSGVNLSAERETETPMIGPTRLKTGAFDPAFLFVVLFPLVIIALSYELLSGERERGTLAMLLSQPVTQRTLVIGKACARATLLCGLTVAFALGGLLLGGADFGSGVAWAHAGLFTLLLVAWALFWFAVAILVNSAGGTSARNALVLVGLWIVLVIVVPGLVSVAVDAIHPAPSSMALVHETREAAQDAEKKFAGITGRHDVDPKKQPGFDKRLVAVQAELTKRAEPVVAALRERVQERNALTEKLRFASPAMIVQLGLEDLAGTGTTRQARFDEQVSEYHKRYRQYFTAKVKGGKQLNVADVEGVPKMQFEEEDTAALVWRILIGVLALLVAAAGCVLVAWPRLQRIGRLTR